MEVLSVASEAYPLIKTGGLADVAGALPGALSAHGVSMRTLIPGYPAILREVAAGRVVYEFADLYDGPARLITGRFAGLDLIVLDAGHLYDRPGGPYAGPDGRDWSDNWKRFAALSWVAGKLALGLVEGYQPQILHAHDWQAGLAPAYVKYGPSDQVKTVLTVHNLVFQGHFGSDIFGRLDLPPHAYWEGVEYYGGVGYLKAGLAAADAITTVSPTYAREIRTPAFGAGLEGLVNARADVLHGITNGIDMCAWDPAIDAALVQNYSPNTVHKRHINKAMLRTRFGLEQTDAPMFAVVSRLTNQKGIDLIAANVDLLVSLGATLVILGSGDSVLEASLQLAADRHPGRVGMVRGYDESLSHMVQGGADAILIPSRFEPCGLTQLYGLRYGCVPIVARVGGLADTVIDANEAAVDAGVATGVQFSPVSIDALGEAIHRTVTLYADEKAWRKMQRRGMKSDVSWDHSAKRYADLYASLLGHA
ncbi:MAG TPA: glycogen synthase GlgA [Devosiaceae bacterium]|nr:glycogen synthase GlgA [Devosiaceae bacterium]